MRRSRPAHAFALDRCQAWLPPSPCCAGKIAFSGATGEVGGGHMLRVLDQAPVYKFTIPVFGEGIVYDSPLDERTQLMAWR